MAERTVSVTGAAGNITATSYDAHHDQPAVITDAQGNTACYRYDIRGRKVAEWGTGIQPAVFAYDEADRLTALTTFRASESDISVDPGERTDGDTTAWTYDAATGLELSKTYADNTSVVKTYDAYNRLATETDARGNVKTHAYEHARGLLLGTTYGDGTPARSYQYNHLSQPVQVTDEAGLRTLGYNSYGEQETDSLLANGVTHLITETRDSYGRSTGYTYAKNGAVQQTVATGYSTDGRIATAGFLHGGAEKTFGYSYLVGSNLLQTLAMPNAMTLTQSYETARDLLTGMVYKRGGTVVAERTYTYDMPGRPQTRRTVRNGRTVNDTFAYNNRSELTGATVSSEAYAYAYDNIGNRKSSQEVAAEVTSYTANALNQYTAIGDFAPTYDADGNQTLVKTSTGIWSVQYNAENRPITFTNSESNTVVKCTYDSMGRRATKKVTHNGSVTLHQRYIYRGYLQIAACDQMRSSHPCLWLITWDPTQPVATHPLAIQKDGTWYCYGWDLTKNICEVFGQHGYIRTTYAYTPYGTVTADGDVIQPLQWSSECVDEELGLTYYNYRHYNPMNGRWLGRDFASDEEHSHLYGYLANKPIGQIDLLGLKTKEEREREMNNTPDAKEMENLIRSHLPGREAVTDCGSQKGEQCAKITVIVEFGNPNSWFKYVGHASMGINDTFLDYGPQTARKPNLRVLDRGGSYYASSGYKQDHKGTADVNTNSVQEVVKNIGEFSKGYVVAAHLCVCQNRAQEIEERMRELSAGGIYSIPGQQCASTVYAALYDSHPWRRPTLSPQGLMLRFVRNLKHECGEHKGKLIYLEFIKDRLTINEDQ